MTAISCEPSGKIFNNLELKDDRIPHNPMINSGNLMACCKIFDGQRADRKYEMYTDKIQKLIGGRKVGFNNEMCLAEMMRADKNSCLLYMLQEAGKIPEEADVSKHLEFYT